MIKKIEIPTAYTNKGPYSEDAELDSLDWSKLVSEIRAHNKLIEGAIAVYSSHKRSIAWEETKYPSDTHKAYLIGIEPIEKDSMEKFVKDFKNAGDQLGRPWSTELCDLYERAKKLLEASNEAK